MSERMDDTAAPAAPDDTAESGPLLAAYDDAPDPPARREGAGRSSSDPELRDIMRHRVGTLHQAWYAACQSGDLRRGTPRQVTIMEEPIVLFRDSADAARALVDRCLHRNAPLGEGRVTKDGCIACPYHGWTYDGDGNCVRVPSEGRGEPTRKLRIERFPVRELDGLVWVWMGDPERAEEVEPFRVPVGGAKGWRHYYMYTEFDGDVTDLVENFMDVPHTAFVHAGWFRSTDKHVAVESTADVVRTSDAVHVTYHSEDDEIGFASWLFNPDRQPLIHTDRFYMPNTTRVDYQWGERRHFIITSTITPITPDRAMVFTSIAFRFGPFTRLARLLFPAYTRIVINQDVDIMRAQTGTLGRFGRRRFFSTEADVIHRSIEVLRDHALRGGEGPPPKRLERRITFFM